MRSGIPFNLKGFPSIFCDQPPDRQYKQRLFVFQDVHNVKFLRHSGRAQAEPRTLENERSLRLCALGKPFVKNRPRKSILAARLTPLQVFGCSIKSSRSMALHTYAAHMSSVGIRNAVSIFHLECPNRSKHFFFAAFRAFAGKGIHHDRFLTHCCHGFIMETSTKRPLPVFSLSYRANMMPRAVKPRFQYQRYWLQPLKVFHLLIRSDSCSHPSLAVRYRRPANPNRGRSIRSCGRSHLMWHKSDEDSVLA